MRKTPVVFLVFIGVLLVGAFAIAALFLKTEPLSNQPRAPGGTTPVEKRN